MLCTSTRCFNACKLNYAFCTRLHCFSKGESTSLRIVGIGALSPPGAGQHCACFINFTFVLMCREGEENTLRCIPPTECNNVAPDCSIFGCFFLHALELAGARNSNGMHDLIDVGLFVPSDLCNRGANRHMDFFGAIVFLIWFTERNF